MNAPVLTTEETLDAYEAGVNAAFDRDIRKLSISCPYQEGTPAWQEWMLGLDHATNNFPLKNRRLRTLRRRLAQEKGQHSEEEWHSLCAEFHFRCIRCGAVGGALEKDHITPIYQRGDESIENIQPLCKHCNTSKGLENMNWVSYRRLYGFEKPNQTGQLERV